MKSDTARPAVSSGSGAGDARAPFSASLRDKLLGLRDRLIASQNFQRLVLAFPPLRPIVRKRAMSLFDLCAGFAYSQILLACVKLRLPEFLAEGPKSPGEVARHAGFTQAQADRILKAAAGLGIAQARGDGRIGLGPQGAALLGNPWIMRFIEHHRFLYEDAADPVALFRGECRDGQLKAYWGYATDGPASLPAERTKSYSELMAASQAAVAEEILACYDFSKHRCLLDIGGGNGTFIQHAARRHPALRFGHFEIPSVSALAEETFAASGLSSRVALYRGDFFADPLPQGADAAILNRIVHDHDDDRVEGLLSSVYRALNGEGVLLIAEPMSGERGTRAATDSYFELYFAALGTGRTRTAAQIGAILRRAGFKRMRRIATRQPLIASLVAAFPQ